MIPIKYFDRDYTADELDRGKDMKFHPCYCDIDGRVLIDDDKYDPASAFFQYFGHKYCEESHQFFLPGGWGTCTTFLPRISTSADVHRGDPYPTHWDCDPFNGELLK
jgi:hypothetical protein